MDDDDSREEVPMTAELLSPVETVTLTIPRRPMTWAGPDRLPARDGHRHEILDGSLVVSAGPAPWPQTVAGELLVARRAARPTGVPFAGELRPAELVVPGRED